MVTIKKTLTLFLVIVMLSGVVALPAFATTLDSVVPCGQITSCEKCGATVPIDVYSTKEDVYVKCDRYPNTIHKHILTYEIQEYKCTSCGYFKHLKKSLIESACTL